MTYAEKEALRTITRGMEDEERAFLLKFIPTDYIQDELVRREEVVNITLGQIRDVINMINDDMILNEKEEMLNNVIEIITKKHENS